MSRATDSPLPETCLLARVFWTRRQAPILPVRRCRFRAGVCGYAAARVDNVNLAVVAPIVAGDELIDDRIRRLAVAQEPQALGAIKRIDKRLRCNRSDTGGDERHPGAGGKKFCCDCNAETAGGFIAGNDGPGHVRSKLAHTRRFWIRILRPGAPAR